MSTPDWVLFNRYKNRGQRWPKMPKTWRRYGHYDLYGVLNSDTKPTTVIELNNSTYVCCVKHCRRVLFGKDHVSGKYIGGNWFCEKCAAMRGKPEILGPPGSANNPIRLGPSLRYENKRLEGIRDIVRGSLQEWEYRFWVGEKETFPQKGAICRVCRATVISTSGRFFHKGEKDCFTVMTQALKILIPRGRCLVCDQTTTKQRWGVPLCSPNCVETWKFDRDRRYIRLGAVVRNLRMAAEEYKKRIAATENGGSKTSESSSNPATADPRL